MKNASAFPALEATGDPRNGFLQARQTLGIGKTYVMARLVTAKIQTRGEGYVLGFEKMLTEGKGITAKRTDIGVQVKRTCGVMPAIIGVSKMPGAMVITRIPKRASSRAAGSVRLAMAPLDAEYAAWPICPSNAATEAVLMITPRSPSAFASVSAMAAAARRNRLKLPIRLTLITWAKLAKTGVYQPEWLGLIEPSDFSLEGYQHHAPMTAPMAV